MLIAAKLDRERERERGEERERVVTHIYSTELLYCPVYTMEIDPDNQQGEGEGRGGGGMSLVWPRALPFSQGLHIVPTALITPNSFS